MSPNGQPWPTQEAGNRQAEPTPQAGGVSARLCPNGVTQMESAALGPVAAVARVPA